MSKEDWPSYYNDDAFADTLDESQKRYLQSPKGKAALKRYAQSDKGKETFKRYYQKKKGERQLAEAFKEWQEQNPDKDMQEFLKELNERKS